MGPRIYRKRAEDKWRGPKTRHKLPRCPLPAPEYRSVQACGVQAYHRAYYPVVLCVGVLVAKLFARTIRLRELSAQIQPVLNCWYLFYDPDTAQNRKVG